MKRSLLVLALLARVGFGQSVTPEAFTCKGTYNTRLSTPNVYTPSDEQEFGLAGVTIQVSPLSPSEDVPPETRRVQILGTRGVDFNHNYGVAEQVKVGAFGQTHHLVHTNTVNTKVSNFFFLHLNESGIGSLELTLTSGSLRTYTYDVHCKFPSSH